MTLSRVDRAKEEREQRKKKKRNRLWGNAILGIVIIAAAIYGWQSGLIGGSAPDVNELTVEPAAGPSSDGADANEAKGQDDASGQRGDGGDAEGVQPEDQDSPGKEPVVRLSFVGDIMMAGKVEALVQEKGYDFPFQYVKGLLQAADLSIGNLETPLTTDGVPAEEKDFIYKTSPLAAEAIANAGIDIVNLANNHTMDQGEDGLLDTFKALNKANVKYVGAGKDSREAYTPVIVERQGIKMAILGFTRVIPDSSWYAGKNKPGVATTYEGTKEQAAKAIKEAKQQADLVIVIAHWGKEREDYPVEYQKELAQLYVDSGADLIVGGHPHVLQGFERYKDKWIAYSVGNFVFTLNELPKTWDTMVLQAECTKSGKCDLQMKPFRTDLGQPVPLEGEKGTELMKHVESISSRVSIDDHGRIESK
ncbi:CapA family protein [Paenibacillus apiarius]|uniref:CapA family protein n=1 Tax=Paenibacillus apiarius TaxID=46240 RepID=UPI00197F2C08|nr:CapA family protein [Paenibacillus apiarius]MBN3522835.1 CapA family protein [Paenibacillus apiarius]